MGVCKVNILVLSKCCGSSNGIIVGFIIIIINENIHRVCLCVPKFELAG